MTTDSQDPTDPKLSWEDGMTAPAEGTGEAVKRRRRRTPTWAIHSAADVRTAGRDGPDWWDRAAPVVEAVPTPPVRPADETAR